MSRLGTGNKKRKYELDLDAERTLYQSFVAAANSISQLYTQAVQQHRKASAVSSRQTLERLMNFVAREYGASDSIPKAALIQFLQSEYENIEGSENLPHQFPVHFLPTAMSQGTTMNNSGCEESTPEPQCKPSTRQPTFPAQMLSPGRRIGGLGASAMETTEHDRCQMDMGNTNNMAQPANAHGFGYTASFPDASKGFGMG